MLQQKTASGAFFDDDFRNRLYAAEKPRHAMQPRGPIVANCRILLLQHRGAAVICGIAYSKIALVWR
jgi:hypothetical protein